MVDDTRKNKVPSLREPRAKLASPQLEPSDLLSVVWVDDDTYHSDVLYSTHTTTFLS